MASNGDTPEAAAGRPNIVDETIGTQLRGLRLNLGMSELEFATLVELTPKQLHRFERAQQRLPASRLMLIANILQVPIGYFFEPLALSNKPASDNIVQLEPISPRLPAQIADNEEQLLECFRLIPDARDRQLVIDLASRLAPDCHSVSRG